MREELLNSILSELNGSTAVIEASAVLSTDGRMMASMLPAGMDEDRVGAMSAAMLSLGDRTSRELARGELEQVLVKGAKGYVLMPNVNPLIEMMDMREAQRSYEANLNIVNVSRSMLSSTVNMLR